jgi:hypothetical protein
MNKTQLRVCAGVVFAAAAVPFLISRTSHRVASREPSAEGDEVPSALAWKMAQAAKFAPWTEKTLQENPDGFAEQDWLEHNTDGLTNGPTPFIAFANARKDWKAIRARGADPAEGPWIPYGPTNGVNDPTNPYRDRSVYNAGTENFGGRTVHAVISPNCTTGQCTLWIANANGGVWRTANALAPEPTWAYVSPTFDQNNVSALELDPSDSSLQTLWAGTGEPNACGSGCEVGVGVYQTKDGGGSWRGPLGASSFSGRAVGTLEVKPGDSATIFAGSGRATRGISNTCCGGTDALVPGAPHFGVYRSSNEGQTWELVSQGATALCTASHPDVVSLNQTPCSPRGARRVKIDPVDPNTVYASFFARGIWRSRSSGDPGTWEQIMARVGPATATTERAEFDVVELPNGETRMYVGVGGGGVFARFRRNDDVRSAPAATVLASWITLTSSVANSPGYSSFGYCDPQCSYDNYVYVPPASSGATPDTVYLLGDNEYNENNHVTGRSNGRAVLLSTDAGATFTDMTEDSQSNTKPGALHPDHHALVVNPSNWRQFFDLGDGGVARSNGVFVDESADCAAPPKSYKGGNRRFCEMLLSRVPERLHAINKGLRTLHFYEIEYDRANPERIAGGTQDNGSWETINDKNTWVNVNVADGGHNSFDAPGGDPEFALTGFQGGQLSVRYDPLKQVDVNWIADTLFVFYGNEGSPFIANAITDPVTPGGIWTGREHVFRSTNWGRNPVLTKEKHRQHCSVWFGDGDIDEDGTYEPPTDLCDDFKPLGDPGPNGRLTAAVFGDRAGGHVAVVERAYSDTKTLWAATSTGRVFVSKNADHLNPAAVTFTRLDSLDTDDPPRYPTAIFVDRADPNHAWITYSGYNVKTPPTPGHVFEIRYDPVLGTAAFTMLDELDGDKPYGDIPANSIIVTSSGRIYVGNDYGVVVKQPDSDGWKPAPAGLPAVNVPDLVYVPEKGVLYAATHGQGVWQLKVN